MTLIELVINYGLQPQWKSATAGGEYCSPCPRCAGIDRFYMQPYRQMNKCMGFYCCRKCEISGDSIQFARDFLNLSFSEAVQAVNATFSENAVLPRLKGKTTQLTTLKEPSQQWIKKATEYVQQAHTNLIANKSTLSFLEARGISLATVQHCRLGWSAQDSFFLKSDWGLETPLATNEVNKIWLPQGIVIPINKPTGETVRLKIRRHDWKNDKFPKYIAIPGSMNGLSLIGNLQHKIMIVVESELDAYAVHSATHDFALTVAIGSNIKNPDNVTNRLAKKTHQLLICHDNDEGGETMLIKWKKLYPHATACPTPIGKDIGEAVQQKLDIRSWFLKILGE